MFEVKARTTDPPILVSGHRYEVDNEGVLTIFRLTDVTAEKVSAVFNDWAYLLDKAT